MSLYPIERIKDTAPSTDGVLNAIKGARDGMCSLYKSNPDFFTGYSVLPGVSQGITNLVDNLCSDKPLPPPQSQPFTGGQCTCVTYLVRTTVISETGAAPVQTSAFIQGPVLPLSIVPSTTPGEGLRDVMRTTFQCVNGVPAIMGVGRLATLKAGGSVSQTVTRQDNLPDTCGNPDRRDPPSPTVQPPSITVNVNTPDIRGNLNLVVPVIIFRPVVNLNLTLSPKIDFNIPIKIGNNNYYLDDDGLSRTKPDNININFSEVNTNISSSTTSINNNTNTQATNIRNNVRTDTTNIVNSSNTAVNTNTNNSINSAITTINNNTNAVSNASVTTINNNTNAGITDLSTKIVNTNNNVLAVNANVNAVGGALVALNNSNTAIVQADIEVVRLNVTDIKGNTTITNNRIGDIITRLEECPCPPDPTSPDIEPRQRQPDQTSNDDPKVQAVLITLTTLPVKGLWGGGGGAPDKHIAGWFAWKIAGGGYAPQMAINYQKSVFVRPPHSVGYAYTLTNRARGFATEYALP